jgi:hypothetical protein
MRRALCTAQVNVPLPEVRDGNGHGSDTCHHAKKQKTPHHPVLLGTGVGTRLGPGLEETWKKSHSLWYRLPRGRGNPKGEADPTRLLMFLKTPFRTWGGPRDGRVPSGLGAPHAPSALHITHAYK